MVMDGRNLNKSSPNLYTIPLGISFWPVSIISLMVQKNGSYGPLRKIHRNDSNLEKSYPIFTKLENYIWV